MKPLARCRFTFAMLSARSVAGIMASVKLAIHALSLRPYGFFRDELYYIACSNRLDFGYVDQPPLSIALLRLWRTLFGDSLAAVRMASALVGTATIYVTGLLAMALGGGRLAVALACFGALVAGQYLGTAHYYSMNVFDQLFWTLAAYVAVRALSTGTRRAWVALGVVLGLGLLNKISVLWLGVGLAVGLVATPARSAFRTIGPYLAAAIAFALLSPYVVWEIRHGWPTLEFMNNALKGKYLARSAISFFAEAIDHHNPFTLPLWAAGIFALVSRRLGGRAAAIGWIFPVVALILMSSRTAKSEYLSPAFAAAMAAGGVFWERALAARRPWVRRGVLAAMMIPMGVGGVLSTAFAVAPLPEETFIRFARALGKKPETTERRDVNELGQFYADMHGWPELAAAVADVYDGLSPDEKRGATIWNRSNGYGPAAAIEFFGRARGLPTPICGHNNYWYWGYGNGDGKAVIVVGGDRERHERYFDRLERVATFECTYCRPDENHKPIYVGRGLRVPFATIWERERAFD
jgi:hypothetical protein